MNAIGYMRLSIRDQSHNSLEYQEESIRDYCRKNGIALSALFKITGKAVIPLTGRTTKRWKLLSKSTKGRTSILSSWTTTALAVTFLKP